MFVYSFMCNAVVPDATEIQVSQAKVSGEGMYIFQIYSHLHYFSRSSW
jgi:hypothetical protein